MLLPVLGLAAAALSAPGCCPKRECQAPPRSRARVVVPPPQPEAPRRVRVRRKAERAWPYSCERGLEIIRRQLEAHIHLSELVGWYARTRGEKSMKKVLYVGREQLISRRTLAFIKQCLPEITDPAQRKATEFLRDHLAMAYIDRKTAALDDDIAAAALGAKVKLPWRKLPVGYRQLPVLLSRERSAKRRARIGAALSSVRKKVLNPLLMKKLVRAQELAQWMGYQSYVHLSAKARRVNLPRLIAQGAAFVQETEPLFRQIMDEVARENLGVPLSKVRRADHARIFRAAKVERNLPQVLMIPAFQYFLAGVGLDMSTAAKTEIEVDDAMHPDKNPRAACFPLDVPKDIRITVKPAGGLGSWTTFFHEGGHALHFAWTTTKRFEFQQLGSYSLTEAMAELFARLWEEPAWLARYNGFVREVRRGRHRALLPKGARVRRVRPLSKRMRGYLIRNRLAYNLYLSRRYGWAKLIYETVLYGGPESHFKGAYTGQTADRQALYRKLFSKAYGYALSEQDASRYLSDVDPFFYAADYTRAFQLADLLHEHLRAKFGPRWMTNAKVGAYLKTLWADGNRYTAEEIARKLGKSLDYAASQARLRRLYAAAQKLSGRKAPRVRPRARTRARARPRPRCKPTRGKPSKCKAPY